MSATIDRNSEEQVRIVRDELAPRIEELCDLAFAQIHERAAAEGWSEEQAEWLSKDAVQPFVQAVLDGTPTADALPTAYVNARRRLTVSMFDEVLERGDGCYAAFLAVLRLEQQAAGRLGLGVVEPSDAVLLVACSAVEAASGQGMSSAEQIGVGLAVVLHFRNAGID